MEELEVAHNGYGSENESLCVMKRSLVNLGISNDSRS